MKLTNKCHNCGELNPRRKTRCWGCGDDLRPKPEPPREEIVPCIAWFGTFAPTWYYDHEQEAVVVVVETKQMIALTRNASNPADDSEAARWGRSLLQQIAKIYEAQCQKNGPCEVRLARRRYDSEPV
jgi:hypothetical protein